MKRLIQFLYAGEYEPKSCLMILPDLPDNDEFPHTCPKLRSFPKKGCTRDICGKDCHVTCDKFICLQCFPPAYEHLLIHSKMYECAEKYGVVGLKDVSKKNFETVCGLAWDKAVFAKAATHVFSSTPDCDKGLRDIIAETICEHPELLQKREIEDMVKEFQGLAFSIIKQKLEAGWNC